MKRLVVLLSMVLISLLVQGWGFYAHKKINRLAVFTLPEPMFGFYKEHIEYLTDHAVDADKRRYASSDEACRHYLDADHYEQSVPIDTIPHYWKSAIEKYTQDTLEAYGIVTWHIPKMVQRLTYAFKERNLNRILWLSADLGHYVGDCHVPLHSTENYNGQLTGQRGIHGFWESRLPELYSENYDLFTGQAEYISNVQQTVWKAFEGSFGAKDSVLEMERQLNARFDQDRKYTFEQRGASTIKNYSEAYSLTFHTMLDQMVERRMKASIKLVGSLWYTAWVNAGQPDLQKLLAEEDPKRVKQMEEVERKYQQGNIIGRSHD